MGNGNGNIKDPRTEQQQRRRSSSLSQLDEESEILFLLEEEEEKASMATSTPSTLPDRWIDYFCIVGLDPNAKLDNGDDGKEEEKEKKEGRTKDIIKKKNGSPSSQKTKTRIKTKKGKNDNDDDVSKPILLDRYPKENRTDMEFPEHLSTFCFPNGYHPLKYKVRTNTTPSSITNNNKKSNRKKQQINIRYHHNVPEP